jgi:hypothetical protein
MSMQRKNKQKKISITLLVPVLAMFLLAGCDKPNINFGTNFVSNNNTNIIVVDTFSANLSTVALDSFATAGTGAMLIGSYNDSYFGNIVARSFLQIGIPTIPALTVQSTFDSISLIMRVNKNYFGDTTLTQRYYVSQLDTPISLPKQPTTQSTFYNNSTVPFNPVPLGFTDVTIRPTAGITSQVAKDSVKVRLPDALGQQLLDLMYRKSDTVTNLTSFVNFFKGLCIYSDSTNKGAIYSFRDSLIIRLYYHNPGAPANYFNVDFPMSNGSLQFNQVTIDRSATPLSVLTAIQASRPNPLIPAEVPSSLTNNSAFIQSMTGLEVKVKFPSIFTLSQFSDYIGILKAQLILKPLPGTYSVNLPLPPQVIASQTGITNQLGGTLALGNAVQYGNLITDYTTGQNTSYTYDVTSYLQQQILISGNNDNGLILNIPSPAKNTTFNRAVLGDKTNRVYNTTLRIYYISLPH